jgi:hypothetical protein
MPTPSGRLGCGESHLFIVKGSNITFAGEGHCVNRLGSSSTFGFTFLGFGCFDVDWACKGSDSGFLRFCFGIG